MFIRLMPGLGLAMLLGIVISLGSGGGGVHVARAQKSAQPAHVSPQVPAPAFSVRPSTPDTAIRPATRRETAAATPGAALSLPIPTSDVVAVATRPAVATAYPASDKKSIRVRRAAPAAQAKIQAPAQREPLFTLEPAMRTHPLPGRRVERHGPTPIRSDTAYANVDPAAQAAPAPAAASAAPCPPGAPPCPPSLASCPDAPPKDLRIWGSAAIFKEKQKQLDFGVSFYEQTRKTYSLGFMKDWSVTTTVGLSADYIDAEVKSQRTGDTLKNDVTGFIVNGHLKSLIMDKFPVDAKLMYGRLDHKGSGMINGGTVRWNEEKHKSDFYGFSGKIGIPLVFGDDIKIAPEVELNYFKLNSKEFTYTRSDTPVPFSVDKFKSTSFNIPIRAVVKKDFIQCWGLVTPRLTAGIIKEFEDSAMGVRSLNSTAAANYDFDLSMDKSQRTFYQLGVGLDLHTNGGWDVTLDYYRYTAKKYSTDMFKLELGKCF